MRNFFYIITFGLVITLAYWAYQENVKTQIAMKKSEELQTELGKARAKLAVLKAEWAYLNRPERLIHLTNLGFDQLKLGPIRASNFEEFSHLNSKTNNINWSSSFNPQLSQSEVRLYNND
ncbi:MAG: cell division protein FtsL [Paracoccaceae bacterium]|nr:cell division protein FtsL [Paracoccaceae bacterium]